MPQDISEAENPDLRASLTALRRAAVAARKIAIQTGTGIVIVQNGQMRCITAEALKAKMKRRDVLRRKNLSKRRKNGKGT